MAPLARPSRKRTPSSRLEAPTTLVFSAGQVSSSGGGARRHRKDSRQQNSYHPPVGRVMTKDELSEWRAAERKKRNRLAAAASRNKLRQKTSASFTSSSAVAKRPRKSVKHAPAKLHTDSPYSTVTVDSSSVDTMDALTSHDPLYSHPSGPYASPSPFSSPYPYPAHVVPSAEYFSYQAGVPCQSPFVNISSFELSFNTQTPSSSACSNGFITRDAHTVVIF